MRCGGRSEKEMRDQPCLIKLLIPAGAIILSPSLAMPSESGRGLDKSQPSSPVTLIPVTSLARSSDSSTSSPWRQTPRASINAHSGDARGAEEILLMGELEIHHSDSVLNSCSNSRRLEGTTPTLFSGVVRLHLILIWTMFAVRPSTTNLRFTRPLPRSCGGMMTLI